MERPVSAVYKPACLPGPWFDDIRLKQKDSIIAGYGKYLRPRQTCETNKYGEMKKHYCSKNYGKGSTACMTDKPPPAHEECEHFFNQTGLPKYLNGVGKEVKIKAESGEDIALCFPSKNPENETYGWCKTWGDFYNIDKYDEHKDGWGFCSKDCYLDTKVSDMGVLRVKKEMEILPDEHCKKYLRKSMEGEVEVVPIILCVAKTEKWEENIWVKTREGYIQKENTGPITRYGTDSYVASQGTCHGDSGGPVFVKEEDRFVVTGKEGGVGTLSDHSPCCRGS